MVRFETNPLTLLSGQGINGLLRVAETLHAQMAQEAPAASQPTSSAGPTGSPVRTAAPRAELTADKDAAKLVMLIPGFGPDHLSISVERASVTVIGERELGPAGSQFHRSFKLPFPVDADRTKASVEFGVLTLDLPRLAADKPQRISVEGATPRSAQVDTTTPPAAGEATDA